MQKLDNLVLEAFKQKVYTPAHIKEAIDTLREAAAKKSSQTGKQQIKKLETELHNAEQSQDRLYHAVEKGLIELDAHLSSRFQQNKQAREALVAEIANLRPQQQSPLQALSPAKIAAVSKILVKRLSEASPYSRAYLRASLTEIRVTKDFMGLRGPAASIASLVAANGSLDQQIQVPSSMYDWRARRDSNS